VHFRRTYIALMLGAGFDMPYFHGQVRHTLPSGG
jgi:hypothetical protein